MNWTMRKILMVGIAVLTVIAIPILITNCWEDLEANQIMVVQAPWSGELIVYTEPGVKWQGFGSVTKYPRRGTYTFEKGPTSSELDGKKIRFNDGGHGTIYGSISWEMPLKPAEIIAIHKTFHSAGAIETTAVSKMIDSAIYLAGPLMSSTESSGERRADLVQYIGDQAENGIYVTRMVTKEVIDPFTGGKKEVVAPEIVMTAAGLPKRQQASILIQYNIPLMTMSISDLKYEKPVEDQISERQKANTAVQISQANARKAEQDAITTEQQGKANAAKAKWDQETVKATEVTKAEQGVEVAKLAALAAEQYKREQILRGEGDAQRKQLVMAADGALDQKLKAYVEVNARYADAIKEAQPGAWTPSVMMGSSAGGNGAPTLVDLFTAKAAKDLGMDMSVAGKAATAARK